MFDNDIVANINKLDDIVNDLRTMANDGISENIDLISKGINGSNEKSFIDICNKSKETILDVVKSLEDTIVEIKNKL